MEILKYFLILFVRKHVKKEDRRRNVGFSSSKQQKIIAIIHARRLWWVIKVGNK